MAYEFQAENRIRRDQASVGEAEAETEMHKLWSLL